MDIENLYHQARQVAAAEGLTNEDVALQGLNPGDPLEFITGVGNHIFLVYSRQKPLKADSWAKMPAFTRKWYLAATDTLSEFYNPDGSAKPH